MLPLLKKYYCNYSKIIPGGLWICHQGTIEHLLSLLVIFWGLFLWNLDALTHLFKINQVLQTEIL